MTAALRLGSKSTYTTMVEGRMELPFDVSDVFLYEDNLGVPPPQECEYLIDDQCPCLALCVFTELWRDCCGCEPCCICGM